MSFYRVEWWGKKNYSYRYFLFLYNFFFSFKKDFVLMTRKENANLFSEFQVKFRIMFTNSFFYSNTFGVTYLFFENNRNYKMKCAHFCHLTSKYPKTCTFTQFPILQKVFCLPFILEKKIFNN